MARIAARLPVPNERIEMSGLRRATVLFLLVLVLGVLIFLATWTGSPPKRTIEFTIPDAELPR